MIKTKSITIERAEGPSSMCATRVFHGETAWRQAESWLRSMGNTYPTTGGYDKHDLLVEWEDGEKYEGRLDCKHPDCEDNDLDVSGHVRHFLKFLTGEHKPSHMKQADYDQLTKDGRQEAKDFLVKYQIGYLVMA